MDKLMIAFTNMMDIGYKTMLIVLVILAARFSGECVFRENTSVCFG